MMSNIVHNPQGSCLSSDLSQRSLHLLPVADPGDAGADEEGQGELKAAAAKAQANSAEASSALTDKTEAASTLNLELEQLRCELSLKQQDANKTAPEIAALVASCCFRCCSS
ncbi:TPA: hypothetical protein ACH3X2_000124 [Trebouxia sp. C0005]